MITFTSSVLLLVLGYIFYGKFVSKFFGASSKIATPVKRLADGVDYNEIKPWKMYIIQFLNIAGLGPIFGAILGAAYGPVAYIWIVAGCIFMGAAHDYFAGMLSLRNDGTSLPEIVGKYLGGKIKIFMIVFTGLLLLAVGASFVTGPSDLLASLTNWNKNIWLYIIFSYYLIATLLPINKIIGKIYPILGAVLLFMAVAIGAALLIKGTGGSIKLINLTTDSFHNFHTCPGKNLLIPMLFIVISCGAISGFHATQSPLMARCMADEKYGRPVFYGAMISEGIVALIWATAAMAYFGGPDGLNAAAAQGMSPAIIVNKICKSWLGITGGIIAILGVIFCPITTGDTAFRSLRLIIADGLKFNQKTVKNRLIISIPLFFLAYILCTFDFSTIWKYVGISNQVLAAVTLWTISAYFKIKGKPHWIMSIPATFLTFVCISYFFVAPYNAGGLSMNHTLGYITGTAASLALLAIFCLKKRNISSPVND
ncbi:MAG: carbon starvation protein A [Bacteroidales bacterium]|jgi:carbon starvation protein CstA|nr:carbon starvation protein A [Bacteroidales bacterium]